MFWGQALLDYGVTNECYYAYTCVEFWGKMVLVKDSAEKQHGMEVMVRQVSPNPEGKLAKINPEKYSKTTIGRIDIEGMTGKKHKQPIV